MPVAGGTIEVFRLYIGGDNRLISQGKHRYPSHMAMEVDKALAELRAGNVAMLTAYGDNLATVKERLQQAGVKV